MADNASAYAALDEVLHRLRTRDGLDEDAAVEVRDALRVKQAQDVAAQRDPYGHPWRPGANGQPVLVNSAAHTRIEAEGTTITFELDDIESMHHRGSARGYRGGSGAGYGDQANLKGKRLGGFRRPQIPFAKIPGPYKDIIRRVLERVFAQHFRRAA